MSWITDLAGRAEDFLVKIDKNAAVAAQAVMTSSKESSKTVTSSSNHSRSESIASNVSDYSVGGQAQSASASTASTSSNLKSSASMSDLSKATGKQSKVDLDAALMASLNRNGNPVPPESNQNGDLSLQQENNLLKQEIKSLSQEIRQAMQSAKHAERG